MKPSKDEYGGSELSKVIRKSLGTIDEAKAGNYIMLEGFPCRVTKNSISTAMSRIQIYRKVVGTGVLDKLSHVETFKGGSHYHIPILSIDDYTLNRVLANEEI